MTSPRALSRIRVAHLPQGYSFHARVDGDAVAGFGIDADQVALVFRRAEADDDHEYPLVVYVGTASAGALTGTEGHIGTVVELAPEISAEYHDGLWAIGDGPDARQAGPQTIHWDASVAHSLTVRSRRFVFAVRGPKHRGATFDELAEVTRSVQLA